MKPYVYVLKGDPIPLARARYNNRRVYDSQKELKLISGITLSNQHGDKPFFTGPVHLQAWFYFPIPPSWSKRKKTMSIKKPHLFRPDIDNLVKYLLDISNGILYKDDCCVCSIEASKLYDVNPRSEFILTQVK